MDLTFVPQRDRPFTMEVEFYDTVREIKQKIEQHHGIPVSHQTLVLNGLVLPDVGDVDSCRILTKSRIDLVVAEPPPKTTVTLRVKIRTPQPHVLTTEMDPNDTVRDLKVKILEAETTFFSHTTTRAALVLRSKGQELQETRHLREYGVADDTEIELSLRRVKRTKVIVRSKCGTKRVPVWVVPSDNVEELRPLLQMLHKEYDFPLPPEYFFIHKQNVMDDDRSFQLQGVAEGHIIDVFPGSYTYASSSETVTRVRF